MNKPTNPKSRALKQSPTSSTDDQPKAAEKSDSATVMLRELQKMIAPSVAFNAAVAGAGEDDIRFRWVVEIVRGEDTPFGRVAGTSTLPGLLHDSQIHMITEKVSAEMISKIADPVTMKFQHLQTQRALALTESEAAADLIPSEAYAPAFDESSLALEAEIISEAES